MQEMEPEELACSSNSESSGEESLCEEEIEEEGCIETILVPKRNACSKVQEREEVNEEVLGGLGFSEFFLSLVSAITREQLIRRSPRGQLLGELLDYIQLLEHHCVANIAILLVSELNVCLLTGRRHKLPSVAHAAVWSAFHRLRDRRDILQAWSTFIMSNIPATHRKEHHLALQVILDRMLKKIIANKAEAAKHVHTKMDSVRPLTVYESNAVRYMAGYVAVKLLKKYRRCYKNPAVQLKHKIFVRMLERMKAVEQPGKPDSLSDYSTLWMEVIDRGGLYHINDDVFHLMESIEMVVRQHFNVSDVQTYVPGTNICKLIQEKVFSTHNVMICWERIAEDIPHKYEKYSVELLAMIADLWVKIRGHSFAKGWTMKFERKYKKGTRKSLQPEEK